MQRKNISVERMAMGDDVMVFGSGNGILENGIIMVKFENGVPTETHVLNYPAPVYAATEFANLCQLADNRENTISIEMASQEPPVSDGKPIYEWERYHVLDIPEAKAGDS